MSGEENLDILAFKLSQLKPEDIVTVLIKTWTILKKHEVFLPYFIGLLETAKLIIVQREITETEKKLT